MVDKLKHRISILISKAQAPFIPDQSISDNILPVHELAHSLNISDRNNRIIMAQLNMEVYTIT